MIMYNQMSAVTCCFSTSLTFTHHSSQRAKQNNYCNNPGSHLLGNTAMPTITDLFLLLWPLVIDLKEPAVREKEMKETMVRGRIVLFSVVLCLGEHKSGNRV